MANPRNQERASYVISSKESRKNTKSRGKKVKKNKCKGKGKGKGK